MDLLSLCTSVNSSSGLEPSSLHVINSPCGYYHYLCDGTDDRGWGCGYRTTQSLCSWVENQRATVQDSSLAQQPVSVTSTAASVQAASGVGGASVSGSRGSTVPSIGRIQEVLVELGDKTESFSGSREWIGSFECCIVLDHLYQVPCRIVHASSGDDIIQHIPALVQHFKTVGSPVMIGGNVDSASKTLIGICVPGNPERAKFLIADPHYCGPVDEVTVVRDEFVKWHGLELFEHSSFYNFCLPQCHTTTANVKP